LKRQEDKEQRRFKISYYMDPEKAPSFEEIRSLLRQRGLRVRLLYSHGMFLDVVPLRASPGLAIRFLGQKWDLAPHRMLVAGDSGTDEDMLRGNTLGVVVGNYSPELEPLRGEPRIYFATGKHAWGILEGIEHYDFLGDIKVPEPQETAAEEDSHVVQESS
jgi:sucrose-phosphate synthase